MPCIDCNTMSSVSCNGEIYSFSAKEEEQELRIKLLDADCLPYQAHDGEWFDVKTSESFELYEGDTILVRLGFCLELPKGYEAHLAPRSSTFEKYGLLLTNSVGVIDNLYCGDNDEWMMRFYCTRNGFLQKGHRVGQFRIMKQQPKLKFVAVNELGNDDRNGYGSTGE